MVLGLLWIAQVEGARMKATSMQPDAQISILMKGPPGYGKTIAAASFALQGPVYIAYFDKKKPIELLTYFTEKRFGAKAKKILNNIEYDIYGAPNCHEYLNKLMSLSKDCRYTTVITDSLTNLTAAAVNWSLGFRQGAKKDPKNKDAQLMIPDFDEYKVETSMITQALDICKSLPSNIIWTAHPLPSIKIEGAGASIKVTKTNPIVTYGSKVAGMVPGLLLLLVLSRWPRSNQPLTVAVAAVQASPAAALAEEVAAAHLLPDLLSGRVI